MLDKDKRNSYSLALKKIVPQEAPEKAIARLVFEKLSESEEK